LGEDDVVSVLEVVGEVIRIIGVYERVGEINREEYFMSRIDKKLIYLGLTCAWPWIQAFA
jgi:hypothetical protein